MTQNERRRIFEDKSRHIADSLKYLPAIARQLYHARDLGEPFDFLTWFEYAPEHAEEFEDLVGSLRDSEEWSYRRARGGRATGEGWRILDHAHIHLYIHILKMRTIVANG